MNKFVNKLIRKLFLAKEIISKDNVLHFQRWRLFWTPWFALYIHFIYESDKDLHLHSHPWNFISLVLKGGYWEEHSPNNIPMKFYDVKAVKKHQINKHKTEDFHRITLATTPTVSLFFTYGKSKPWGYLTSKGVIDNETYRKLKEKGYWNKQDDDC